MWSSMRFTAIALALAGAPALVHAETTKVAPEASSTLRLDYGSAAPVHRLDQSVPAQTTAEEYNLAAMQVELWGPQAGDWEFTLTGAGTSDRRFRTTQFGAHFSIGHFFTENILVALRQSIEFIEDDGTNFAGSTRVAADYHFNLDRWRPFLGASFGGIYGDGIDESFLLGLEGGVKWYVRPQTFIMAMVEYQWFFERIGQADDRFDHGRWVYTLGIGFNF
jgi:hypothetical protein